MTTKITIPEEIRHSLEILIDAAHRDGLTINAARVSTWLAENVAVPWVDGDVIINHEGGSQLTYVRKDGFWAVAGRDVQRRWTCEDARVDEWDPTKYVALVRGGKVVTP